MSRHNRSVGRFYGFDLQPIAFRCKAVEAEREHQTQASGTKESPSFKLKHGGGEPGVSLGD